MINAKSNPDLNTFVENLNEYKKSPQINHHSKPLSYFLGKDERIYSEIFSTNNLSSMEKMLKEITGAATNLKHLQATKKTNYNPEISRENIQRIKEMYAEDYKIFGKFFK